MPEELIRETISLTRTSITDDDREIASEYNKLVKHSLKVADWLLSYGSPATRLKIVTACMSSASRLASLDSKTETEQHRVAFERLIDSVTKIPEIEHVVTKDEIIDVVPKTVSRSAHDQDNR
jgi:hypothetical protein